MIASGGFGTVWRAQQKALDRPVAIKTLHAELASTEDAVRRFEDEARLTASISHEGVVTLLDHGVADSVPWMAFEFVDGPSLRSWVERGPTPWRPVCEMARQVALALEEARRCGVVHRDVKPDNILQASESHFKVADFGVAKWAGASVKTQDGVILGTPAYISPVTVKGLAPDHQSDLYALGITMFELMAGRVPFFHENPILLLQRHISQPPPPLREHVPDAPPALERIVMRLMAKERADRYDTAADLAQALEAVLRGASGPALTGALDAPGEGRSGAGAAGDAPATRRLSRNAPVLSRSAPVPEPAPPGARTELAIGMAVVGVVLAIVVPRFTRPRDVASPAPVLASSASPATTSPPATALAPVPPSAVELDALFIEAIRIQSESDRLLDGSPRSEDALLGVSIQFEERLKTLSAIIEDYAALVRSCADLRGPGTERLLLVERTGKRLVRVAEHTAQLVKDSGRSNPELARWPEVQVAMRRLEPLIAERAGSPLGGVLHASLSPLVRLWAGPVPTRTAELHGSTSLDAARLVQALGSSDYFSVLAEMDMLDRAINVLWTRRRRDDQPFTTEVGPSTPAEREGRERVLALAPLVQSSRLPDPLLADHDLRLHEQVIYGVLILAGDPAARREVRVACCHAAVRGFKTLHDRRLNYYVLHDLAKAAIGPLRACAKGLGEPLDEKALGEAEAYFAAMKPPPASSPRAWPIDLKRKGQNRSR